MDQRTIIDYFPDWITGGGIVSLLDVFDVPWKDSTDALELDFAYVGRSGDKIISPFLEKMDPDDVETPARIAATIFAVYGRNWSKLWDTMMFEYNPISNYDMEEHLTNDATVTQYGKQSTRTDALQHTRTGTEGLQHGLTETRTDNLSHTKTGTESLQHGETATRTDNLTHTKTGTEKTDKQTGVDDTTNSVWGFNSNSAVPSDKSEHSEESTETTTYNTTDKDTGTSTTAHSGTDTTTYNTTDADTGTSATAHTGTDTTTFNTTDADTGTQRMQDSGSDTRTRNYTLTRSGNIGVTTSQQMIQSERDLWIWNFFNDVVFKDLDKALTIQVY